MCLLMCNTEVLDFMDVVKKLKFAFSKNKYGR